EQQLQREHHQHQQEQFKRERDEIMSYAKDDKQSSAEPSSHAPQRTSEDPMPSTSDFVKKLYKMLEDPSFQSVVCWGPQGDCFVVKDMNEFTKSILPRMFKHSNFASFVRQLNKYDFHKVKNTDDNQFGEHSWTFRHPDFHADRRDALENIKRKVPAQRKNTSSAASGAPLHTNGSSTSQPYVNQSSTSTSLPYPISSTTNGHQPRSPSPTNARLTSEVQRLKDESEDLRARIRNLERNYESVLVEMVGFQRGMAQQDGLMQNLIAYFLGSESGE
ncbi:HSF-type DNA-binding-domain-containing protein, partial [Gymnopilus junonius]